MADNILTDTSGLIEISKASELNVSKETLYKYIRINGYEKVGPGIFISPDEFTDELAVLSKRCPNGVISHDDALFYYGLTDREPESHSLTVYSGYNASRLIKSGYKVFYVNRNLLKTGATEVTTTFGNVINMYDLERTIVDLVRSRTKFEIQDLTTAMKTYARRPDKDLIKLSEYAKLFGVEKILRTYMEVLL